MKNKSLFRDISSVFGSNIFAVAVTLLSGVLIARYLGPAGKGAFTALTVVPVIASSFAAMGIRRTAVYFTGSKQYDNAAVASAVIHILILTSLLAMALTVITFFWLDNPAFTLKLITLTVLIIPFRLATVYIGGIYLGQEKYRFANLMKWLVPAVNLLLLIVFLVVLEMNITGAVLALLLSGLLVSLVAFRRVYKDFPISWRWNSDLIKKMVRLGIMYAASLLVLKLIYRIDILLLERLADVREVGFYSTAVNVAEQLWQIPLAVGIVIMSATANSANPEAMKTKISALFRLSLLAGLAGGLVLFFITPWLIPFLYGEDFTPAVSLLQALLPGIILFIAFRILNSHFNGIGKPVYAVYAVIPALVLNVLLNFLWIPAYGAFGAAMATNLSYVAGAALMIGIYVKKTKTSLFILFLPKKSDFSVITEKIKARKR